MKRYIITEDEVSSNFLVKNLILVSFNKKSEGVLTLTFTLADGQETYNRFTMHNTRLELRKSDRTLHDKHMTIWNTNRYLIEYTPNSIHVNLGNKCFKDFCEWYNNLELCEDTQ